MTTHGPAHQLVLVAHGTRNVDGNQVSRAVAVAAGERLGIPSRAAFVELSEPLFSDVMVEVDVPVVVVPMLLSTGFHVRTDLPEAVAKASVPVTLGTPLGPDPLLAAAQVERLLEAGAERAQRVVLVAAGSSDEAATCDQVGAVALLARAWGSPVELATLSGHGPRPADVVRPGDAVSPYLLSPGFFHDRTRREAGEGVVVADVIGPHPRVVDLVVERAEQLMARSSAD
ncbi:sirohydrochlorin chelatase [Nocardioides dongxiaopingii]|uniref:sirohydrochlorin chelatase n=1 Tax=Nocardioides sp. S-1144 TaxID=2582905 RepID=UPI001165ADA2|nr:CbiX/SirB N-terminal domain-containing protein [Nocardioides sp. S-1144]QCW49490.2 sirohydrochlorin chelatase [Nocardioides sp. S-1144]